MDAQGWAVHFLAAFGVAGFVFVMIVGIYTTRAMDRSRKAGRAALVELTRVANRDASQKEPA
ncbi:MAG: hypothetical protein Q7T60_16985 [Sphingopyxis sp.]|nr:hypothetical protein [Sphingopyxis sp.]